MKHKSTLRAAILSVCLFPMGLFAQSFDTSGNSLLRGNYFFRQVAFDNLAASGAIGRARSLTGNMTFDGNGNFMLSAQLSDSTVSSGAPKAFSYMGTYSVASSGMLRMQNPLSTSDQVWGGVGQSAFVGSTTEGKVFDLFVGVPAGSNVSNSSLSGAYAVGAIDFPNGDVTKTANSSFTLTADGNGKVADISVTGHAVSSGDKEVTQTVSGSTYALNNSGGLFTFPSADASPLLSGARQFYVSADGNIFIAGSTSGYDLEIGIRPLQGTASNASYQGTYFSAGTDLDSSGAAQKSYYLDAFYGSVNVNGRGTAIVHERLNPSDTSSYDYTFDNEFNLGTDGVITQSFDRIFVGAGAQMAVGVGRVNAYSLELDVAARTLPATGSVFLNPIGVVNAANYAPITNPVTPGEMIRLYGTGLSESTVTAAALPLPSTLGGVSVSINGRPAPIYQVSPGQIICIVPYATSEAYAKIQVTNNGVASNSVTVFTEASAPGVFTVSANGIGPGAVLHADGSLVTTANPARWGETVIAYVTGLGAVAPTVTDGAAAPGSPLSKTIETIDVFVDTKQAAVSYAGLAPGFVGLYQINFTVPQTSSANVTDVFLDLADEQTGGYSSFATIAVSK